MTDRLVFYPTTTELLSLVESITPTAIVRVRQTNGMIENSPNLVARSMFRTSCIDLTQEIGVIYRQMGSSSCRYCIRRVEKIRQRAQILWNGPTACRDFLTLYNDFVRWKRHTHPLSLRRLHEYLRVSDVTVSYLDDEPICGHLIVRDDQTRRVRLVLSASSRFRSEEHARWTGTFNRYLHWHEFQVYQSQGMDLYDLGGVGDGTSSIAQFKLAFGGFPVQDHSYVLAGKLGRFPFHMHRFLSLTRRRLPSRRLAWFRNQQSGTARSVVISDQESNMPSSC